VTQRNDGAHAVDRLSDGAFLGWCTRNLVSAHVLEKIGFLREGTLREDCVVNGEPTDSWVFGMPRRGWSPASETAVGS
jgi:ribosomal-protein-alanine N-acetyltransferase